MLASLPQARRQKVTRSLMLACLWATAHTRKRRQRVTRSLMLACSWATAHNPHQPRPKAAHVREAPAPHPEETAIKTQGRGARGAFSGSGFALCFTFQPLSVLRPCPAPAALKVGRESGLAIRFGSFVCYRLELARRSHHLRRGAHFGRCRRCRGTTIVFW